MVGEGSGAVPLPELAPAFAYLDAHPEVRDVIVSGGDPLAIVTLFGDTPRALATSPDGSSVYAAVFHSGNRTTTVTEGAVTTVGLQLAEPEPLQPKTPMGRALAMARLTRMRLRSMIRR